MSKVYLVPQLDSLMINTLWVDLPEVPRVGEMVEVDDEGLTVKVTSVCWTPKASSAVAKLRVR